MMDHEQAIQTQASIRYAVGELTGAERDSFEEHFADCPDCMKDVETSTVFAANTRAVFREQASAGRRAKGPSWFAWRPFPALALSAAFNVVLVAGLGYGLLHQRTASTGAAVTSAEPESVDIVAVHGATRGAESPGPVVRVSHRPIVLTFDLPQSYEHYLYSVERDGTAVMAGELPVPGHADSLNLEIPANRLSEGQYRLSVTGTSGAVRDGLGTCLLQVDPK
jgi:hypothetical protein